MMEIGQSAGKDYAYLVGVYLGDGCVTHTPEGYLVFRLNTIDQDFAEATRKALRVFTSRPISIHLVSKEKDNGRPQYNLRCGDAELCSFLVDETKNKKRIPESIRNADPEEQRAFIVGLMDSEGFVGANSNPTNRRYYMGFKSCDVWVPDFIRVLKVNGIRIGKVQIERPMKEGYLAPTRFTIKMQSWIDSGCRFNIERKQRRVDEWASAGAYENRARYPRRSTSETARWTA